MSRWAIRRRLPADVRAVLASAGERLLGFGRDLEGQVLVATDQGLWGYGQRLAWTEIDHAGWHAGELRLLAVDGEQRTVQLGEPGNLPAVVRDQVEASVLVSRAVPLLPDGRGVTVVARRQAGGPPTWQLRFDPGVDAQRYELAARQALAEIQGELGG